jgi:hypothetical protein
VEGNGGREGGGGLVRKKEIMGSVGRVPVIIKFFKKIIPLLVDFCLPAY